MNEVVLAKDILKRDYFASHSEFYLVLAIGKALKEKGYILNMDNLKLNVDATPEEYIKYYKKLLNEGYLSLSMYEPKDVEIESKVSINTDYFSSTKLWKDNGTSLDWDFDFTRENYGIHVQEFLDLPSLGGSLIHLVGYHLANVIVGDETRKLVIHFDSAKTKTTFLYEGIYSCLKTLKWIKDYVALDIDTDGYELDLDYLVFCSNSTVLKRYKPYTVGEKLKLLDKYNMREGSILVLWTREGMCENNIYGHVTGASIVRVDEVGDDFIGVTKISVNKTMEEVQQEYNDIDESIRYLFIDMLNKKPHHMSTELALVNIGVDNYLYDEKQFLTTISDGEEVQKLVTIDGNMDYVKMEEVDAVYWLLCQYDVEFDKDLYKEMYFHGTEPLWDKYN